MPSDTSIPVKGPVLEWARLLRGYTQGQAASLLDIPLPHLRQVEAGERPVTPALFRKMIGIYQQTESSLLRPKAPKLPPLPEDFRTTGNRRPRPSPDTSQAIREARRVQRYISELVSEDPELIRHAALRKVSLTDDPEYVAAKERPEFNVPLPVQKTRWRSGEASFGKWRARLQERGILVLLKEMPWEDCRGLSLWENEHLVPAIVVNSEDAHSAAVFTMFHEYGHLLLRRDGICVEAGGKSARGKVEDWCNSFAAAFLIPEGDLRTTVSASFGKLGHNDWTIWHIGRIAGSYRVSREVMARRLQDLGISNYYKLNGGELAKLSRKTKRKAKPGAKIFALRSEVKRVNEIGYGAASIVLEALKSELIDVGEAADILELQVDRLDDVEEQVELRRVRDVPV